jgi:hypothetical protein
MTYEYKRSRRRPGVNTRMVHLAMALAVVMACSTLGPFAQAQCLIKDTFKTLPTDGAASDFFGLSVAVSGTTAIVGAYYDDDNGSVSGSAYLFDTTTGNQIHKLLALDGAAGNRFGYSVAIDGNIAIIGAPWDNDNGTNSGSAYLFNVTTGAQIHKLLPFDGAGGDFFGWSVGISGSTAIVGAHGDDDNGTLSGSAYTFDTTGTQLDKLLPGDGEEFDSFGYSVAISGPTAIVGAFNDDDNGNDAGAAYLFDTTTGNEFDKLLAGDGAVEDYFGSSVAISGTTAICGAYFDDDEGSNAGAAYLFDTTTGTETVKLLRGVSASGTQFGWDVAIDGTLAVVSAHFDTTNGSSSGAAYLYDTTTGDLLAKFRPADGAVGDWFGKSVGISGTTIIGGAERDDDNGNKSGSAYLFGNICPASTIGAQFTCLPASGTVPFSTQMTASLESFYIGQTRRIAGHLDVTLADSTFYGSWRAGTTNVGAGGIFAVTWPQDIPGLGTVIGDNLFELQAEDVTTAPYNQPPYPPAGDTATASCTVTGVAP